MSDSQCPSRDELIGLASGTLPEGAAKPLLDHIGSCPDCEVSLDTITDTEDTLIALLRVVAPPDPYEGEIQRAQAFDRAKGLSVEVLGTGGGRSSEAASEITAMRQLGEYQLLEKLGEGGMGAVYKALQINLEKVVAVKVLAASRIQDEQAVARFKREMKAVGRLDYPNIVQAHDARDIEGTHVLVMEYVDGVDLSSLVKRCGTLSVPDACELIRQAAV